EYAWPNERTKQKRESQAMPRKNPVGNRCDFRI
ncbi:unnamed protein product, partial [marine sediment metagenome]